jgi:hypothetical protein
MESQSDDSDSAAVPQHTKTISTVDSANQVFGTTELLEAILEQLPPRDLLVNGSRVCRTFNTAIKTSIRLRRRLFLEPAGEDWPFPPTNLKEEFCSSAYSGRPMFLNGLHSSLTGLDVLLNVAEFRDCINNTRYGQSIPRSMHITQPPSERLSTRSVTESGRAKLRSLTLNVCSLFDLGVQGGITLGDLEKWVGDHPELQGESNIICWDVQQGVASSQ